MHTIVTHARAACVDAVVLCLALMGTNYAEFLREAHRILKMEGTLLVAEVRSRIEAVFNDFLEMLKVSSMYVCIRCVYVYVYVYGYRVVCMYVSCVCMSMCMCIA